MVRRRKIFVKKIVSNYHCIQNAPHLIETCASLITSKKRSLRKRQTRAADLIRSISKWTARFCFLFIIYSAFIFVSAAASCVLKLWLTIRLVFPREDVQSAFFAAVIGLGSRLRIIIIYILLTHSFTLGFGPWNH
jgi:hypothetical protein